MKKQKQLSFEGFKKRNPSFGGSEFATSNPKTNRPLSSKLPILLTMRARQSGMRLPKTFGVVNSIVGQVAKKHGVRIYSYANVGNHLHILIRVGRVSAWRRFIRELAGRIALAVKLKGIGEKGQNYWLYRPHTRIVGGWRNAFQIAKDYVYLNICEAEGNIRRSEIKTLKDFRALFSG